MRVESIEYFTMQLFFLCSDGHWPLQARISTIVGPSKVKHILLTSALSSQVGSLL